MIPHLYGPPESFPSVCLLKNRLEAPPPSSLKTEEALAVSSARQSDSTAPTIAEWCVNSLREDAESNLALRSPRESDEGTQPPMRGAHNTGGDARPAAAATHLPLSGADGGDVGLQDDDYDIVDEILADDSEASDAEDEGDRRKLPAPTEQLEGEAPLRARADLLRAKLRDWKVFSSALDLAGKQSDPELYRQGIRMGLAATIGHNLLTGQDD